MSWSEVYKINNNMKRTINEQLRDMMFRPVRLITTTSTYVPEKTGLYRVICVGAGGGSYSDSYSSNAASGGGGGGVAIKTIRLDKTSSYDITVSSLASFGNILTAANGASGGRTEGGAGGTASGGDYNFDGEKGIRSGGISETTLVRGGSIGVVIGDLCRQVCLPCSIDDEAYLLTYGDSILNYGGGAPACIIVPGGNNVYLSYDGLPACVIIIPLEMEE